MWYFELGEGIGYIAATLTLSARWSKIRAVYTNLVKGSNALTMFLMLMLSVIDQVPYMFAEDIELLSCEDSYMFAVADSRRT